MDERQVFASSAIRGWQLTLWAWFFALVLLGIGIPWVVWVQNRPLLPVLFGFYPFRNALYGLATGVVMAFFAWHAFLRISPLREVLYDIRNVLSLSSMSIGHVVLVALSAGVGEEFLFRGVIQYHLGLWWTSLLFGLAHPLSPAYILYATAAGLVLGGLVQATGALLPAILCHTLVDAILLYKLKAMGDGRY